MCQPDGAQRRPDGDFGGATARSGRDGPWRGDVQGLRALAVLAVVAYHAGVPGIGGGFVGVDCFFVISGFLITGLLLGDLRQPGHIQFLQFYARRARRILPVAMIVLIGTGAASVACLPPLQARQVLRDCLASALFLGNYRFAALGTDYLSPETAASPVQHFWSLGVEEQFYLCWPLLIALAALAGRAAWRRRVGLDRAARIGCAAVMLTVVAVSWTVGIVLTRTDPPWAFFSLFSRGWELGVGGLLALAVPRLRRLPYLGLAVSGWIGLAGIVWSVTRLSASTAFPGVAAAEPVLATALVLAAGHAARRGPAWLLDRPGLRHVGDLSYSWYLWHWPVLVLVPAAVGHSLPLLARIGLALGSLLLAEASWRLVESPVRFARPLRAPRRALPLGAVLIAVGVLACSAESAAVPATSGRGPVASQITLAPLPSGTPGGPGAGFSASSGAGSAGAGAGSAGAGRSGSASPFPPSPWQLEDQRLAPVLAQAVTSRPVPRNLTPSLAGAAGDKAPPFVDGCNLTWTAITQPSCTYTTGSPTVVLFGDSHAAQWFPPLDAMATQRHWRLQSFTKTTCPPLIMPVYSPYLGRSYTECSTWRTDVLNQIRAEHAGLVILGVARHYGTQAGFTVYGPQWLAGLAATVRELHAAGIPVLVMGPTPKPPADVPTCLSAHLGNLAACDFPRSVGVNASGLAAERAAVDAAGGSYLDISPWICTSTSCAVVVANMLLYRDDNHLTTSYTSWLQPALQPVVQAVLAGRHVST